MNQTVGYFTNLGDLVIASLQTALARVLEYIPEIIGAIIILIIGWIIAAVVGGIITRVIKATNVDSFVDRSNLNGRFNITPKYKLLSGMIGQLVKWFIIIATLIAAANSLHLSQITDFLNQVALYIPRAIVAVAILCIGMLLGEFIDTLIKRGLQASKLPIHHKNLLAGVAKYAIIVFSVMAALVQLNIVPQLIEILFGGLVLALALAFGLGGREEAARLLTSLRTDRS